MEKTDYKKTLKHLYVPPAKKIETVIIPAMNFLMVDGAGNPNTSREFQEAIEALYAVAFTAKFKLKFSAGADYVVPPLEGLWWAEDMETFMLGNKEAWKWTLMIMQPPEISCEMAKKAVDEVCAKKKPAAIDKIRFESYDEGLCAQTMHLGSFDTEGPTITRIHQYISDNDCRTNGKHHEIYLSDFRRIPAEKLKTVIRQPMIRIGALGIGH